MALYVVALVVAVFAAFGVDRLQRGEGMPHVKVWLGAAGAIVLLALLGAFGGFASFLAQGVEQATRLPVARVAAAAAPAIKWGAVGSGVALGLLGALALGALSGRVKPVFLCIGLAVLVSADLWRNDKDFWVFSDAQRGLHGGDEVTDYIKATPKPYRILNFPDVYPGSSLQSQDIPQLLGYHGNELHRFDELMGGKNVWRYVYSSALVKLLELFAVQHVVASPNLGLDEAVPQFTERYRKTLTAVTTSAGVQVDVYSAVASPPYGRLVPAAVRLTDEQAINTVLHPDFPPDQLVLLSPESEVDLPALSELPSPLESEVVFEAWEPGAMRLRLSPPASQNAYLVVSENWYPDWHATVDGADATVLRGDVTLITVPVSEAAESVELRFRSTAYRVGKLVTLVSLAIVVLAVALPMFVRRARDG
jgi:hypothetical protein